MPLVLGLDSSLHETVAEVRDADSGALVATGRAPHPVGPSGTADRAAERDPSVWWTALLRAVAGTGRQDIAAMSVAGQSQGMVLTDQAGAVLRPAVSVFDRRAVGHARRLVEHFGPERWWQLVGLVPDAGTTIAQLGWLRSAEPEVFARIGAVMVRHDWLTFRLTGRVVTDRGDASGTGYWSPRQNAWQPELLAKIDPTVDAEAWSDRLPTVVRPTAVADWLSAAVHEIVGLRGRPVIAAGTGRRMALALAAGVGRHEAAVAFGHGGATMVRTPNAVESPRAGVRSAADATGDHLAVVPLTNAISATRGVAAMLGVGPSDLDRMARRSPAGAGGLVVVPPRESPAASGAAVHGLTSKSVPEHAARAAYEGAVCAALEGLDAVTASGATTRGPLRLTGAAASSPAYRRILADLSGRPVAAAEGQAPVATGACVQAAAALAGVDHDHIIAAWGLRRASLTEPDERVDRVAVRAQFTERLRRPT